MDDKAKKPKIDARALVARLNQESLALQGQEILAPLLPNGKIRTRLGKLVHEFKPSRKFVGWGHFKPLNEGEAEPIGEALPWERAAYLELFPILRMILLWPITDEANVSPNERKPKTKTSELVQAGAWLALPYNEADAAKRFGISSSEPVLVFLCDPTYGAERFERIIARVDGSTLWYDSVDMTADPMQTDWLRDAAALPEPPTKMLAGLAASQRLALLYWQVRQLELAELATLRLQAKTERERSVQKQAQKWREQQEVLRQQTDQHNLEGRLRYALTKAEATLHSYTQAHNTDGTPGAIVVEWSERGQTYRYRSTVNARLGVVSSGVCLSGRDHDFDLTSLVRVMIDRDHYD